jgi:hypothetical protein
MLGHLAKRIGCDRLLVKLLLQVLNGLSQMSIFGSQALKFVCIVRHSMVCSNVPLACAMVVSLCFNSLVLVQG